MRRTFKSSWRTGVFAISGEKKTGTEDKDRLFSERCYGRFERHILVEVVDEDKVSAAFKNGAAHRSAQPA